MDSADLRGLSINPAKWSAVCCKLPLHAHKCMELAFQLFLCNVSWFWLTGKINCMIKPLEPILVIINININTIIIIIITIYLFKVAMPPNFGGHKFAKPLCPRLTRTMHYIDHTRPCRSQPLMTTASWQSPTYTVCRRHRKCVYRIIWNN